MSVSHFEILKEQQDGCVRLALTGELDLAAAPVLEERLAEAHAHGGTVRLDLSRLVFIDSTGLHALIRAMDDSNANGWRLQIGPEVTPQVMRLFKLVHFDRLIPGYDSDRS